MKKNYFIVLFGLLGMHSYAQIIDLPVTASNVQLCGPGTGQVDIANSQAGVDYTLRNSSMVTVGGPTAGNGNSIGWSFPVNATETFTVLAEAKNSIGLELDGTNDYVAADSLDFDYNLGYTYEAWVKTPKPSTGYYEPVFYVGTPGISDIEIYVRPNDLMVLYERGKPGLQEHRFPSPPDNVWFHLAVTYNGSTTKVYYNGVEQTVTSGTPNGTLTQTNGAIVNIGLAPNITVTQPDQRYLEGQIDDIRIWSTVRTEQEIQSASSTCLTGLESGLEIYYSIEGVPGTSAIGNLAGNNAGQLTNFNTQTAWVIVDNASAPCPSTATLQLSNTAYYIVTTIDVSVTNNTTSLTANQAGAMSYEWINCQNFASAGSGQTFTPTASGQYAVVIGMSGCIDTSACETVVITSATDPVSGFALSPNPSLGQVKLQTHESQAEVYIWNPLGQHVADLVLENGNMSFNLPELKGIYLVQVRSGGKSDTFKIIRQ